jgi:hypothetical protein
MRYAKRTIMLRTVRVTNAKSRVVLLVGYSKKKGDYYD